MTIARVSLRNLELQHSAASALILVISIMFYFPIVGCNRVAVDRMTVSGASTLYPILELASPMIEKLHGIRLQVNTGGSRRGFDDVCAGRSDVGTMARDLASDEVGYVLAFPIALDGVGIVLHASNPLREFTTHQLRAIYCGEIGDWRELGGSSGAIIVVSKAEGHATLQVFAEHTGLRRQEIRADVVAGDNAQVICFVSANHAAIGYVSMADAKASADSGAPVALASLDGILPTLESVADGTYPLRRTLYLVTKGEPTPSVRVVIDFFSTPEGKQVVLRANCVPLN